MFGSIRPAVRPVLRQRRFLQTATGASTSGIPRFAFAFDIDGVLVRGRHRLPRATEALNYLKSQRIPFILLTNGGGYHEEKRARFLTKELDVEIDHTMIVQSHTPFADMNNLKDKTVLVCGGDYDNCRVVAKQYGFKNVVLPSDLLQAHPEIYPFSKVFKDYHSESAAPLPMPVDPANPDKSLKIDAVFVYNDPRDWGLDISIIIDCLLSRQGIMGTLSAKNDDPSLPNRGYQQDGQPPLYFSNPDLWFAAEYALNRFGQGGFRAALEGVWNTVTGGRDRGVDLTRTVIGKPSREMYLYAEKRLRAHREALYGPTAQELPLQEVYMVGDNPESDIQGANNYQSPHKSRWYSTLVRSGVYAGGVPAHKPTVIVDDVFDAVNWGVKQSGWRNRV